MLKAVLFDLDDTLLANDMDRFLPVYLKLLSDYTLTRSPKDLVPAVMAGVLAMIEHDDAAVSIYDVFWARFTGQTGLVREEWEPFFHTFYRERFPELAPLTAPVPGARALVDYCLGRGLSVVVATNPVFPREAILQRLRWAGLDPAELPFALITTYDNMHFTKSRQGYYREIIDVVGCAPNEAFMVGNDRAADIEPAAALGLGTCLVRSSSRALVSGGASDIDDDLPCLADVLATLQQLE